MRTLSALVLVHLALRISSPGMANPPPHPVLQDATVPGLTESYAKAIHWFRGDLEPDDAYALATFVIESGHRNGHDTRLALAVVAEEGLFDQVQHTPQGLRIGPEPASRAIDAVTLDLIERVERLQKAPPRPIPVIDRALAERAQQVLYRKDPKNPKAAEYAPRVLRRYQLLCGPPPAGE